MGMKLIAVAAGALIFTSTFALAERGSPVMQRLMSNKLEQMQKLQAAMILEDYKEIGKRANLLIDIARDATWQSLRTKDYQRYSRVFQDAAEDLKVRSKDKKLSQVTMPFLRLNMACMECHTYVRNRK